MDKEKILRGISNIIPSPQIKHVFSHDGNKCFTPITVITAGESEYRHYHLNQYFVTLIAEKRFYRELICLNPLVIETVLNGKKIFGCDFYLNRMTFFSLKVFRVCLLNLLELSSQYVHCAHANFRASNTSVVIPYIYLSILFATCANYYLSNERPITIGQLLALSESWPLFYGIHDVVAHGNWLCSDIYKHYLDSAADFIKRTEAQMRAADSDRLYLA